jgi:hypothetical protein
MTEEERFSASDHTPEELDNFIESMNQDQFGKVRDYVEKMPKLAHDINFNCMNCQLDNSITVEGMQNFFS